MEQCGIYRVRSEWEKYFGYYCKYAGKVLPRCGKGNHLVREIGRTWCLADESRCMVGSGDSLWVWACGSIRHQDRGNDCLKKKETKMGRNTEVPFTYQVQGQ